MNVASLAPLQALYAAPSIEVSSQLVAACDALPAAAVKANTLVHDRDRTALDLLERIAERAGGIQRLAMRVRTAMMRERELDTSQTPNAA